MACGKCQEKALREQRQIVEQTMSGRTRKPDGPSTPSPRTAMTSTANARGFASRSVSGCRVMQDSLRLLEKEVVTLYKQAGVNGGYKYLQMQTKLRRWITELGFRCPPEDELNALRQEILDSKAKG